MSNALDKEEMERLDTLLSARLGPDYISYRPQGGSKVAYLENHNVIQLANETFGFDGWCSSITSMNVDVEEQTGRGWTVGVTATVRVLLTHLGTFHEDVGYGQAENVKSRNQALQKAKKEAVTDARKRALRIFGNGLGNCLMDKDYLRMIKNMRAPNQNLDPITFRTPGKMGTGPMRKQSIKTMRSNPYASPHGNNSDGNVNAGGNAHEVGNEIKDGTGNCIRGEWIETSSSTDTTTNNQQIQHTQQTGIRYTPHNPAIATDTSTNAISNIQIFGNSDASIKTSTSAIAHTSQIENAHVHTKTTSYTHNHTNRGPVVWDDAQRQQNPLRGRPSPNASCITKTDAHTPQSNAQTHPQTSIRGGVMGVGVDLNGHSSANKDHTNTAQHIANTNMSTCLSTKATSTTATLTAESVNGPALRKSTSTVTKTSHTGMVANAKINVAAGISYQDFDDDFDAGIDEEYLKMAENKQLKANPTKHHDSTVRNKENLEMNKKAKWGEQTIHTIHTKALQDEYFSSSQQDSFFAGLDEDMAG
eukprot:CFRG2054T1